MELTSGGMPGIVAMLRESEVDSDAEGRSPSYSEVEVQVVLESLRGEKSLGQIAKAYGVHANTIGLWTRCFWSVGVDSHGLSPDFSSTFPHPGSDLLSSTVSDYHTSAPWL